MSTPLSDAVRCMVHAFPDAGRKADVRQIADKIAELERENAALKKDKEMLEMERCECLRTMDLALNNNAGLRELVNESYQFFRFGHEDLEFWKKGIDDWCERAERLGFKKEPQP